MATDRLAKRSKKGSWFLGVRRSYIPISWQGVCIYMAYVAYIIAVPVAWYRHGHELWGLLTNVIPLNIGATLLTQFVASKTSKRD